MKLGSRNKKHEHEKKHASLNYESRDGKRAFSLLKAQRPLLAARECPWGVGSGGGPERIDRDLTRTRCDKMVGFISVYARICVHTRDARLVYAAICAYMSVYACMRICACT